jgi:hypothetical protein
MSNFDVSLTVQLSITLDNDQLNAQIFNTFITILHMYMFRAISCTSSGSQVVLTQHLGVTESKWPSGTQVEKEFRYFSTRSTWVRRRPFLLWWMQGHSYSLLWAGCVWKSIAEVLSMIRERIIAWYNLSILNHHVSTFCVCNSSTRIYM